MRRLEGARADIRDERRVWRSQRQPRMGEEPHRLVFFHGPTSTPTYPPARAQPQGAPKLDEAIVRDARDAREAAGPDAKLFVDPGASDAYWPNGLKWALRTSQMLKDYDVGWFEEGASPDALEDYCELRRQSPVPIAGGEVLTRRQAFLPWLMRGAFDIVQPDVTKMGGISEQRRVAWMADEFGIRYVRHGWNTALGVAADLQLAAALPQADLVEFIGGSAYVDGITTEPFTLTPTGGSMIPDRPGLGVDLDLDKVEKYSGDTSGLRRDRRGHPVHGPRGERTLGRVPFC